jgi:hypothetical protein
VKKNGIQGWQIFALLIAAGIVIGLVRLYFQNFDFGYAMGGALLGCPFGAAAAGALGWFIGGHREKANLRPLPYLAYGKGASELRKSFLTDGGPLPDGPSVKH